MKSLLVVLGNQLFDKNYHPNDITDIFMCEDFDLCSYEKHHKKKISFFLTSMREYREYFSHQCSFMIETTLIVIKKEKELYYLKTFIEKLEKN